MMPRRPEIHVLCGAARPASRARFETEAARVGADLRWLDPHEVVAGEDGLSYSGESLTLPTAVLARSGGFTSDRALAALRAYEGLGVRVVDAPDAVERCRDKLVAAGLIAAAGLPVPRTVAVGGAGGAEGGVTSAGAVQDALGGLPIVVKPARGMKGAGVHLATDATDLAAALLARGPLLAQEYVPHDHDLRVIVIGGRPLGAIRRHPEADFRSNLHVGGRAEAAQIDQRAAALAIAATDALGAEIAGVDLLPMGGGYTVLEVNASPGFDGFERETGVNVAAAILAYALDAAPRPASA